MAAQTPLQLHTEAGVNENTYRILRSEENGTTTWHLVDGGATAPGRVRWVETTDSKGATDVLSEIAAVMIDGY